jgi:hypothetical protein
MQGQDKDFWWQIKSNKDEYTDKNNDAYDENESVFDSLDNQFLEREKEKFASIVDVSLVKLLTKSLIL